LRAGAGRRRARPRSAPPQSLWGVRSWPPATKSAAGIVKLTPGAQGDRASVGGWLARLRIDWRVSLWLAFFMIVATPDGGRLVVSPARQLGSVWSGVDWPDKSFSGLDFGAEIGASTRVYWVMFGDLADGVRYWWPIKEFADGTAYNDWIQSQLSIRYRNLREFHLGLWFNFDLRGMVFDKVPDSEWLSWLAAH